MTNKTKQVYIVIEVADISKVIGVYKTKAAAEKAAYSDSGVWRNIIEKPLEG